MLFHNCWYEAVACVQTARSALIRRVMLTASMLWELFLLQGLEMYETVPLNVFILNSSCDWLFSVTTYFRRPIKCRRAVMSWGHMFCIHFHPSADTQHLYVCFYFNTFTHNTLPWSWSRPSSPEDEPFWFELPHGTIFMFMLCCTTFKAVGIAESSVRCSICCVI